MTREPMAKLYLQIFVCFLLLSLAGCGLDVIGPNRAPVAVLLAEAKTQIGMPAIIDGAASFDPDGDAITYTWRVLQGPSGAETSFGLEDGSRTTFTAQQAGTYLLSLVVSDGQADSEPAVARLRVGEACLTDADCDDGDLCTTDLCLGGACQNTPLPDCGDLCPDDPEKTEPGVCGCGVPDADGDGDGTPDCEDGCPGDPDKVDAGLCGCGESDADLDSDGTPDCLDGCPEDPAKTEPGVCGCGVSDDDQTTDTDGDGVVDCNDGCYQDPDKTEPGVCGCGTPEDTTDSDSDGMPDCIDGCPNDPDKTEPGLCGCGVVDDAGDRDGDGTVDCLDGCPDDPNKTEAGLCGCGAEELDSDGDGTCDDLDCAPFNAAIHPGVTEVCNGIDDNCNGQRDEAGCPCTVQTFRDHSYLLCPGGNEWTEARDACRAVGYDLLTVDDSLENEAMAESIAASLGGADTWMGFNDRDDEGVWRWQSGGGTGYTHWDSDQPDNAWLREDCALFWHDASGLWNDANCDDDAAYVCESDCGAGLDSDGDGWGDACDCAPMNPWIHPQATEICNGKDDDCNGVIDQIAGCPCVTGTMRGHVYSFCSEELDWTTARDRCRDYGGELVTLDDSSEQTAIWEAIADVLGGVDTWLGYNDREEEGTFTWVDGSPNAYENWHANEPSDSGGDEDCTHFSGDGRWNDNSCARGMAFVCEIVPCPNDVFMDIDGDGVCGDVDTCPVHYNPDQEATCGDTSCLNLMQNAGKTEDGLYWISAAGANLPMRVWCDMHRAGGGWTMVTVYGSNGRPGHWSQSAYPRPGASFYGKLKGAVMDPGRNNNFIFNASVPAALLWLQSQGEVLAWVGGVTDDYVTASLPGDCNYFDPGTWCIENTHGPFTVTDSHSVVVTNDGYACTTAHQQGNFGDDPYDEFGLHIIDGLDSSDSYNCCATEAGTGFQGWGRTFTTFESGDGNYWQGVTSYWDPNGDFHQPGALFIR